MRTRRAPISVECKWSAAHFDPANLRAFRGRYPEGTNVVVASDVAEEFERRYGELRVRFVGLAGLVRIAAGTKRMASPKPYPSRRRVVFMVRCSRSSGTRAC